MIRSEARHANNELLAPDDSRTRGMEVGTVSLDSFFLLHIAQKKKFLCAIIGELLAQ